MDPFDSSAPFRHHIRYMLNYAQALFLGLAQGVSELFPISSLGHSVLIPALLHWQVDQTNDGFLLFLVATHLATALVLAGFYWKEWMRILQAMWRSFVQRRIDAQDHLARLGWALVLGTVPAGLLGLLFEDALKKTLGAPRIVAFALLVNGLMLFFADRLQRGGKKRSSDRSADSTVVVSWWQAFVIGCWQCLALLPGFSRTGATMTGGLSTDLTYDDAAHVSFLLATPIILAASVLKLPELLTPDSASFVGPILVGAVCAACAAWVSVRFLTKYFQTKTLRPFAYYCLIVGIVCSVLLR